MDILAETTKGFNGSTIQSTIKNSTYYNSEEYEAEIDKNSDPKVSAHTTNRNSPHTLLINRIIPEIIPATIPPIDQTIAEDATGSGETLKARRTIISKEIVTDAARSAARVFRTPADAIRHVMDGTTSQDGNNAVGYARLNYPVRICVSTTGYLIWSGN